MPKSGAVAVSAASPADLDSAGLAPQRRVKHTNRKCSVLNCDRPSKSLGYCNTHRERLRVGGDLRTDEPIFQPPDIPSLHTVHMRLAATRGRAVEHACVGCGRPAAHWAYNHTDPDERRGRKNGIDHPYSIDLTRYDPMCVSCHKNRDLKALEARGMRTNTKGNRWRFLVQQFLEGIGMSVTRRGIGDAGDDLTATLPGMTLSVEAKNHKTVALAAFVDQAERQAPAEGIPVVFVHRKGKASVEDGYVVMSGRAFRRLVQ